MRHHIQEKRRRKLSNRSNSSSSSSDSGVGGGGGGEGRDMQFLQHRSQSRPRVSRRISSSSSNSAGSPGPDSSVHFNLVRIGPLGGSRQKRRLTKFQSPQSKCWLTKPTSCTGQPIPGPTPNNIGNGRAEMDPLPTELSVDDHDLVDFWNNRLSYWSGQNKYVKDQVLRTAMRRSISFQTVVLCYCARWKAHVHELNSEQVQQHLSHVVRLVNEEEGRRKDEDGLAMALGGLALQEYRFGSRTLADEYMSRALSIIRPHTGSDRPVETFLLYVWYIVTPPAAPTMVPSIDPEGQRWLVTFLRGAEELMMVHSTAEYLSAVPQRRDAFRMESPLFPLLSSGPRPSRVPHESRVYVVENPPTLEASRSAALIYVMAALWDFKDSFNKTRRFLEHLTNIAKKHDLGRDLACETFIWLLLEEGYDTDLRESERGWTTGALMKKHKQLRPDQQFHFNEILMSFLMMIPPIRGIDVFESEQEMAIKAISGVN